MFYKFESIDAVEKVCRMGLFPQLPAITSLVKVHGTNGGVGVTMNGEVFTQSRNRIVTPANDNMGFSAWVQERKHIFLAWAEQLKQLLPPTNDELGYIFYGEFAGNGVQGGVAVSRLPKSFFIFDVVVFTKTHTTSIVEQILAKHEPKVSWDDLNLLHDEPARIYNLYRPSLGAQTIVYNPSDYPDQSALANHILSQLEAECPVGKYFGIAGAGEGRTLRYNGDFIAKCKHENFRATKIAKTLTPEQKVMRESAEAFAERVLTPMRLEQGIAYLKEMNHALDIYSLKQFIAWVLDDVFKEEQDEIDANAMDRKILCRVLSNKACAWYKNEVGV